MKHPIALVILVALLLAILPYLPVMNFEETRHTRYDEASEDEELPLLDSDGDGMPDDWEIRYGLNPLDARDADYDKDNDGWDFDRNGYIEGGMKNETFTNLEEYLQGTDPTNNDTDGDGMPDGWEVHYGFDPLDPKDAHYDSDRDGFDENNDGFFDPDENFSNLKEFKANTNPRNPDTDGDKMTDGWEAYYDLDPLDLDDKDEDPDGDGFDVNMDGKITIAENYTNLEEFIHKTNPRGPDTDGDRMLDGWEAYYYDRAQVSNDPDIYLNANQLNPRNPEGRGEDLDNDGLINCLEYQNPFDVDGFIHSNPINNDTDGDGLLDGWEMAPVLPDISQKYHGNPCLDPTTSDTDGDGMPDGWEINWNQGWIGDDGNQDHYLDPANGTDRNRDEEPDGWDINRNGEVDKHESYTNVEEYRGGSNPFLTDTDKDGMPDGWEAAFGLDPAVNDSLKDNDGDSFNAYRALFGLGKVVGGEYNNIMEFDGGINWTNPSNNDTDRDGMWDGWEHYYNLDPLDPRDADDELDQDGYDFDHDGVIDRLEKFTNLEEFLNGTNPYDPDTDGDGMPDGWEVYYGLNPLLNDSMGDLDKDGITNYEEWNNTFFDVDGIIPMDPSSNDTDEDGIRDKEETIPGEDGFITDPTCPDTDEDGIPDGWEVAHGLDPTFAPDAEYDLDNDGCWLDTDYDGTYDTYFNFTNLMEYLNGTDLYNPDTDNDTMPDGWETFHGLNATDSLDKELDLDNDGIPNFEEYNSTLLMASDTDGFIYTDPNSIDTDMDGLSDYEELNFANPTDPTNNDTDFDEMPDGWEVKYYLDPLNPADAKWDNDTDSYDINGNGVISAAEYYTNLDEYYNSTNPQVADTDGDGIWDVWEAYYRYYCLSSKNPDIAIHADSFNPTDPRDADDDPDEDGLNNSLEFLNPVDFDGILSSNPLNNDTDGDGIWDGLECSGTVIYRVFTDPTCPDTDGDGMPDGWESNYTLGWIIPGELGGHYLNATDPSDAGRDEDNDGHDYDWVPDYYRHFTNYREYDFWSRHPEYLCNPFDWDSLVDDYTDGFIAYIIDHEGGME